MNYKAIVFRTLILVSLQSFGQLKDIESNPRGAYVQMSRYLAMGDGIWITPNPKYDSTQKYSPVSIQMNFFWDEERQMLWDSVSLKFKQFDYLTWISAWSWHPYKKHIEYNSYGPEGRFISGITEITNDSTFITIDKMYEPDGTFKELKDENFIVSDKVHRNTSYEMTQGKWELKGTYVWRRKSPGN